MQVIREHGQEITAEALNAMEYADAVSKEALRHRVIVPFVFRRAIKDFQLGPYSIKKVLLSIRHRIAKDLNAT